MQKRHGTLKKRRQKTRSGEHIVRGCSVNTRKQNKNTFFVIGYFFKRDLKKSLFHK
jgi:hypothetical protein